MRPYGKLHRSASAPILHAMPETPRKPFAKPAHWTNEPVPEPKPGKVTEELSPTRYGDWERNGVAVDF